MIFYYRAPLSCNGDIFNWSFDSFITVTNCGLCIRSTFRVFGLLIQNVFINGTLSKFFEIVSFILY